MTIVPFRPRQTTAADYRLSVVLRKDARTWQYQVIPLAPHEAQTWVRCNGQPHRARMAHTLHAIQQIHAQYLREIANLEQDGWMRDAEP